VGSWKLEVGSGKWEVGSGKWEVGSGKLGVGRKNSKTQKQQTKKITKIKQQLSSYGSLLA
jgi:hypothetical protein